jgi:GYF domain 2
MSTTRWYLRTVSGNEVGPYSGTQLRQLAARGDIVADTLVRKDDMPAPVPARRIATLLQPAVAGIAVAIPPPPVDLPTLPAAELPEPLPASISAEWVMPV